MAIIFDMKYRCEYDEDIKKNLIRPIFLNCENSDMLRYINISLKGKEKISVNKQDSIILDKIISYDGKIEKIITKYSEDNMKYLRKLNEDKKNLEHKKLLEDLKQTPEEFINNINKLNK